MRRWLCLATIVGLAGAAVSGCYRPPQPECGFFCSAAAECPQDYQCSAADGRCHLLGSSPTMMCSSFVDAGIPDDGSDGGDTQYPVVVSSVPRSGAIDVGVAAPITVKFSEDVIGVDDATLFVTQDLASVPGIVQYDAVTHVATWTPTPALSSTTVYTANLSSAITDHAGYPVFGRTWTFTTADVIAPTVIAISPIDGATGLGIMTEVSATFSEGVFVPPTSFNLSNGATHYALSLHYDGITHVATLTPYRQLPANTTLFASLSSTIADPSGNPLVVQGWSFETGADTLPPSVVSTSPDNGSVDVYVGRSIFVSFDEPVIGVTSTSFTVVDQNAMPIAGAISEVGGDGSSWRFVPTVDLASLTTFTVTVTTAITDTAGHALPAPVTFSFTTE